MNNQERLEKVKNNEYLYILDGTTLGKDWSWLEKQAEEKQELEEKMQLEYNDHKNFEANLLKKIKQYEKALNDILISDECFKGDILKRMHAMQDKARQALQNKQ